MAAQERAKTLPAGLYLVATPIGNLGDITVRALEILRQADVIACEDTRVSAKLCQHYSIATRRIAYHEHNARSADAGLVARIQGGEAVALISDAGTPLLSDPGASLVRAVRAAGLYVTSIPGPSSVMTALTLGGLPAEQFFYAGFLPPKSHGRRKALQALQAVPATLVFLEAPHRIAESLADMEAVLGPRPAAVARELTKHYEEVLSGSLTELAARTAAQPLKGEMVVLVGPPEGGKALSEAEIDAALQHALETHSVLDAAQQVADLYQLSRKPLYQRALQLKDKR